MKVLALVSIVSGIIALLLTIYGMGRWVERERRWQGCTYVANMGPEPFWACPVRSDSPESPDQDEEGGPV